MPARSEHERNQEFLHRFYAEQKAEQLKLERKLQEADGILDSAHEYNRAMAFSAGLTYEEYEQLLHNHGILGVQAVHVLQTHPEISSVADAIAYVYQKAGNEAGEMLVDPVGAQMDTKFPPKDYLKAVRTEYNTLHPRRRKPKGKGDVIKGYERWQQEQAQTAAADASFEEFLESLQRK